MPWVRIDDQFPQHPKIASVGPLGLALQVAGLCYANRYLTDGFIPWSIAETLLTWEFLGPANSDGNHPVITICASSGMAGVDVDSGYVVKLLLVAGIWEEVSGGYQIHDYADYQPLKAQVEEERRLKVMAGQAGGQASAQARAQRLLERKSAKTGVPDPATGLASTRHNAPDGILGTPQLQIPAPAQASAQAESKHPLKQNPTPNPIPYPSTQVPPSPPIPDSAKASSSLKKRATREKVTPSGLGPDFEQRMIAKFPTLTPEIIHETIEDAMCHVNVKKWTNTEIYVRGWLRRRVQYAQSKSSQTLGAIGIPLDRALAVGFIKPWNQLGDAEKLTVIDIEKQRAFLAGQH